VKKEIKIEYDTFSPAPFTWCAAGGAAAGAAAWASAGASAGDEKLLLLADVINWFNPED